MVWQIYSCRVDSVYSEAYKVIGGLATDEDGNEKTSKDKDRSTDDEDAEADDEVTEQKKKVGFLSLLQSYQLVKYYTDQTIPWCKHYMHK